MEFRRSFVPIKDFNWKGLWSFTGLSFQSRRAINAALIECLLNLANDSRFIALRTSAEWLKQRRDYYNTVNLDKVRLKVFTRDMLRLFKELAAAGNFVALFVAFPPYAPGLGKGRLGSGSRQISLTGEGDKRGDPYKNETAELAQLAEWQQDAEKFLCLMYINFIQIVVARLHTLLVSVALVFSLTAFGIAIYPFVPLTPYMVTGLILFGAIAWSFFKVFSEMDTDPILSRIVNGDERKLEGNFYWKFAESISLPLLTFASAFLPGGAARLLELAQTMLNHGQ
jgi:hypothetical protein